MGCLYFKIVFVIVYSKIVQKPFLDFSCSLIEKNRRHPHNHPDNSSENPWSKYTVRVRLHCTSASAGESMMTLQLVVQVIYSKDLFTHNVFSTCPLLPPLLNILYFYHHNGGKWVHHSFYALSTLSPLPL